MHTFLDWESVKLDVSPGDTLSISVRRGNDQRRVNLTVEPLPTATAERVAFGDVEFITVTPAVQQERRLSRDFGALVFRVSDTATRQTGLREGDVILQVNRQRVESAEALRDVLREASGRGAVRVFYDRDGRILFSDFAVR
jgi:S1-C subfamily serine protease